ncbi:hypothetical protein J1N35_012252 [Gossypium stocksii]|uniref:CW-type domain-containing protein n=1 Tax=Gossypium stocksii TaxID=47602 RepID=A0A9D3W3U1_9ROSI|nr:hypothetical protein J1N35_012252 [Gossypium stocksii]
MISLGCNDTRKGLGLGFGAREMEETELEEGEACSKNDNDDAYDDTFGPKNDLSSLSYIDEKIQHILGHFQKEFEGGVSAENLGAKFGGYGSFLPTYQRSPGRSHPTSSPKVQNCNAPRFPNTIQLEDGRHPTNFGTLPALKASYANDSIKQEVSLTSTHAHELAARCEYADKKVSNLPDQKTLKLRIKMGSDNLLTQKNAAIYSGLGLDVSPSSSLDESPSESEGMYGGTQEPLFESPTSILQLMTSFPVPGEALLSPLSDHLLNLIVKEKILKENISNSGKGDEILSGDEKANSDSVEKKDFLVERKGCSKREIKNGNGIMSKKEVDIDALACEELVSKTLELPLLSNPYSAVGKVKDNSIARNKGVHHVAVESVEPILSQDIGWENPRVSSAQKVLEEQKTSVLDDNSGCTRKYEYIKAENTYNFVKAESNVPKGSKALNSEAVDPIRKKSNLKATLQEQHNLKLPSAKEQTFSGGKNKSKSSHGQGSLAAEVPKDSLRVGSSLMLKNKQTAHVNNNTNKKDLGDQKLERPFQKAEDRDRDIFGDVGESEHEENLTSSLGIRSKDQLKEDDMIGKNTLAINSSHNGRRSGKKREDLLASKLFPGATLDGASNSCSMNTVGASLGTAVPVLINENWVSCDKCLKWRLLPIGLNPSDLPVKWVCSMLNWLPAMNHCSVDEEETTKAVLTLHQVPAVASQTNLQNNLDSTMSRLKSADTLQPEQNQQCSGSHAMPPSGRKKHGLKEISNAMVKDGPTPMKKSIQASVLSGSSTDITKSLVVSESSLCDPRKCDVPVKKHKSKQKKKHKVSEHGSGGGDAKTSKMKGKRISDQDSLMASKKIKSKSLHLVDENSMYEHAGKGDLSTSNDLPTASTGKDQPKPSQLSSYNAPKLDKEDRQRVSGKRPKDKVQVSSADGSVDLVNFDGGEVSRKRKADECINNQLYSGSHQIMGNHLQDGMVCAKGEFSKNEYRQEKKVRLSTTGGKDTSASKNNGKLEKKKIHSKNHHSGQELDGTLSQHGLCGTEDKNGGQLGGSRAKALIESSPNIRKVQFMNGSVDYLGQEVKYDIELTTADEHLDEENQNDKHGDDNVSQPRKLGKGSSWSKDRSQKFKSDYVDEMQGRTPLCKVKPKNGRNNFQERLGVKSNGSENRSVDDNKESMGKLSSESGKRENQRTFGQSDAKPDETGGQDVMCTLKKSIMQDGNVKKYMKRFHSDKSDRAEIASGRGNSPSLPPSGGTQNEILTHCPHPNGSQKGNRADGSQIDDALKVQKQIKEADRQNGAQHGSSRHTGHRIRGINAPSPMRKDTSNQAATNALKEAKDLKHMADRVKNSGSNVESIGLYFQAALKFLYSASLLESCNNEGTKHGEMIQSMQIYSSTAKLFEFCAHEYERLNKMAAASLAYKCTEVAYMRVIYTSHANASRDRHELQTALQMVPPGESPSSSASDVDNLNHPTTADKVAFSKGVSPPQVAANHVISARNRPNFVRFLNFAQDVNYAMEASRKSRIAFAHSKSSLSGDEKGEVIYSVKKALDFNFQDIEGLLRLIRLAMEAVIH